MTAYEPNPRRPCTRCSARTRAVGGLCPTCEAALTGGRWLPVAGIRRWVPHGDTLATYTRRRRLEREVTAERYAFPTWWPTSTDDSELTCARRLRDALAEADVQEDSDERRDGVVA